MRAGRQALAVAAVAASCLTRAHAVAANATSQPHQPFPAFGSQPLRDWGTLALTFVFGAAATASGVGGGAIYVPLFDAVLGLGVRRATSLSQVAITAGAVTGVAVLLCKRHPADPTTLLIDLELAAALTAPVLLGVGLGTLANSLVGPAVLVACLLVLLVAIVVLTFLKGRALHRLESKAKHAARARAEGTAMPPPPPRLPSPPPTLPPVPASPPPPLPEDAIAASQWGALAEASALETLTPRRLRRSWAMQADAAATAAAAAVAAVDEEAVAVAAAALQHLPQPPVPPSLPPPPPPPPTATTTTTKPRHPLFTWASALPLTVLAGLWLVLTGFQVWRARARRCSRAWAAAIASQVAVAAAATLSLMARAVHCARLRQRRRAATAAAAKEVAPCDNNDGLAPCDRANPTTKAAVGPCGREPGLRTPGRLGTAAAACIVAGFIGGLLGLGGGVVVAPLLLAMRLPPPVASATSTLLVLFSASSAAAAAVATPGALDGLYVAAFAPVAALAGAVGVVAAAKYVKRSGRESVFVFLLAGVVAAGAVLTAAVSGPQAVADVRSGKGGMTAAC